MFPTPNQDHYLVFSPILSSANQPQPRISSPQNLKDPQNVSSAQSPGMLEEKTSAGVAMESIVSEPQAVDLDMKDDLEEANVIDSTDSGTEKDLMTINSSPDISTTSAATLVHHQVIQWTYQSFPVASGVEDVTMASIIDNISVTAPEPPLEQAQGHNMRPLPTIEPSAAAHFCANRAFDLSDEYFADVPSDEDSLMTETTQNSDQPRPNPGPTLNREVQVVIPVHPTHAMIGHPPNTGNLVYTRGIKLDPTKLCFLDLAPEIRNLVYEYLFPPQNGRIVFHSCYTTQLSHLTANWTRRGGRTPSRGSSFYGFRLLETCRTIHSETLGYLYGSNRFSLEDTADAKTFLLNLRSTTLAAIREIDIGWITPTDVKCVARLLAKCQNLTKFNFNLTYMSRPPTHNDTNVDFVVPALKPVFKLLHEKYQSQLLKHVTWTLPTPKVGRDYLMRKLANSDKTKKIKAMIMAIVDPDGTPEAKKAAKEKEKLKRKLAAKKEREKAKNKHKRQKLKNSANAIKQREKDKLAADKKLEREQARAVNGAIKKSTTRRAAKKTGTGKVQKKGGGRKAKKREEGSMQTKPAVSTYPAARTNPARAAKSNVKY